MRVVWRFKLGGLEGDLEMPRGAQIVHFAIKDRCPTVWALVDPLSAAVESVHLRVLATGEQLEPDDYVHLCTTVDGLYVWHLMRAKGDDEP